MEQDKQIILTRYADETAVIAESGDHLKRITEKLMDAAKQKGLVVNENETKCMITSRGDNSQTTMSIRDTSFEKVINFKYLGININSHADNHDETYRRITAGNK